MKYSTHDYAQALVAAIEDSSSIKGGFAASSGMAGSSAGHDGAIAQNFLTLVRRNNDEARFGKILDEAARLARRGTSGGTGGESGKGERGAGEREVVIESARPLGKSQEALIKNLLKPGDAVSYKITPDLVAGVKIVVNDEMQFDGSLKAKLDSLFRV